MGFNLCTDDVWDEVERYSKKNKKKPDLEKQIVNSKGEVLYQGRRLGRLRFMKKHFGWTERMIKRGRWKKPFEDAGYKVVELTIKQ